MKTTKHILIALLVLLSCSCKKFLDEKPTNFLTPDADLTSPKVATAFTLGCYQNLQGLIYGQPASYGGNTYNLMEFMTGKAGSDLGQTGFATFQNLLYNNTSFYVDTWWQRLYLGVGACNLAIQNIPKAIQPATTTTNQLATAKTLRALYYFYLVRLYGAVPKVTVVPTVPTAANLNLPRTPAKAIYDSIIIPDLLDAAKSTLPWKDATGQVTMSLVQTLLADVYLTYAGAAINGGNQYYALSAAASKAVIANSGASLFTNYTDMNNPANKNIGEFIFQVQFAASVPAPNPLTALTIPNYAGISKYSDEYGSVYPTPQFIKSFAPGDKRVQERQFFYTKYKKINGTDTVTFRNTYIYKFFDSLAVVSTAKSDLNYTVYRLADVYLLYAEASNRAEGAPNADALNYVKAIRTRAKLGPLPANMSQTDFEHEVWLQRYFELCFENKMWFDMIRTRKVHNDVTGNWDDFVGHKTVYNATFAEKNLLFPVPKQETDVNPNLLPNNPGF